ncbi:hypothetical protein H1P_850007 [Hyella patelloides LEGE 07179]|uniref:Uncharacterized protein n=1 Tax=Hyella patelloides LEGE 07179 TaxID=945734 RepID=A0A563W4S9_9CYAN|nr:hypothetical protein H1P_850007 [Hyella patelloides LEGE 07179]
MTSSVLWIRLYVLVRKEKKKPFLSRITEKICHNFGTYSFDEIIGK